MLTAEQVVKARTFPGCNDITAENAVDKLFAASETLSADLGKAATSNTELAASLKVANDELVPLKAKATPPDASILSLVAMAAETEMAAAVDAQAITPACATEMKALLVGDPDKGVYNAAALTAGPGGKPLAVSVFGAIRRNGKMPAIDKQVPGQPAPKSIPGAPDDKKPMTAARRAELLSMSGLGAGSEE